MHIPDGFIDAPTAVATGVAAAGVVAYSLRRTGRDMHERSVPLLGVTAAFVFAAQMLNFPVAGGTSGHLIGALLAMVLLGPWAGVLVMTAVLVVQALVMADGGITALGANLLNMAVAGGLLPFAVFALLRRILARNVTGFLAAVAVSSWCAVVLASAAAALELAASGTVPPSVALPTMVAVHMIIGLGEALITTTVVAAVLASRPDLVKTFPSNLKPPATAPALGRRGRALTFTGAALILALALAVFVSPFASSSPDGLERVAEEKGFAEAALEEPVWAGSPLPEYVFPGIANDRVATALAGLVGTLVLFALVFLLGRAVRGRPAPGSQ
jgi:cobalt/nickel transport system permease protein